MYAVPMGLDSQTVAQAIETIDQPSWNRTGNSVRASAQHVIVRNTREVHRQIERLFDGDYRPAPGGGMFQVARRALQNLQSRAADFWW